VDKKRVLNILSSFRRVLEERGLRIERLILFGSYALETNREESDIDVVVVSRDFAGKDYWERVDILSRAIYEVFEPIEAIAFTPEEWEEETSSISAYAKNGEVVYGV